MHSFGRSRWPRGPNRGTVAASLRRLWVRIPPGTWKSACCECCVLSGRGLCDEKSPAECGVSESDREALVMRMPCPTVGLCAMVRKSTVSN